VALPLPQRRWSTGVSPDAALVRELGRRLHLSRAAAEILVRRGLGEPAVAERFLAASADEIHDPFLLPDLRDAAARLAAALDRGERIVVHGDYDADGISGAALLTGALQKLGAAAEPFVPDRRIDGYGVAARLVERAGSADVRILVTVDTGSSAHAALSRATALGMDVIVCDHHLYDHRPEGARFFLNPHRPDSAYPNRDLCGCGVAFKLLAGLREILGDRVDLDAELDLVAIALLADQMQLLGENRALVRSGLERISRTPRPGLLALLEVARLDGQRLEADDVAYQIAPRINAAGRVEKARTALQLLLSGNVSEARPLASRLDGINQQRKELDQHVTEEATREAARVQAAEDAPGIVLASDTWHLGVVGIGAARVADEFRVPTVLLAIDGEEARGSARSVPGFDLKAALDLCSDHLTRYGGHAAAAGMTLPTAAIESFRRSFAAAAARLPRDATPSALDVDCQLALEEIDRDLAEFLNRLGPFGPGNSQPVFASYDLPWVGEPRVVGKDHLRLSCGEGKIVRGFIGFGMAAEVLPQLPDWPRLDIAYRVRYREGSRFDPWQLTLHSVRPAAGRDGDEGTSPLRA
jgi:single-stranded-DNA-specific exonuclease